MIDPDRAAAPPILVAGRFRLGDVAGEGGEGTVFAALDEQTGERVALKVLRDATIESVTRFAREAAALARIEHPRVAGYVAHGATDEGGAFLAMRWIEGPTLAKKLRDGRLAPSAVVALGRALASALEAIHRAGIVHRDVKPGNVVLADGLEARATLLDFGVAREEGHASPLTRAGVVVGTPGYLAPEQVRGEAIEGRTDLFSLGAVLYHALTGKRPFGAGDLVTVLARTALEDPPPIADDLGTPRLRELIAALLAKRPDARPASARAVHAELDAIAGEEDAPPASLAPRSVSGWISSRERRLAALVVARLGRSLAPDEAEGAAAALRAIAREASGELEWLPEGAAIGFLDPAGLPRRAAIAALDAARVMTPLDGAVALVTGATSDHDPLGELWGQAALVGGARGVAIDPRTAALLASRFVVEARDGAHVLLGERLDDGPAALLGRATPTVGRDREIATLAALYGECVEEREARAAIVRARAGLGKSRVRSEVVARLPGARVWHGRPIAGLGLAHAATPTRSGARPLAAPTGAVHGLLADLLARLFDVDASAPADASRVRVLAGARELVDPDRAEHVATFLAEVLGVAEEPPGVELAAARERPDLMGQQLRRAWLDLVGGALEKGPLAIVLEDAHDADRASLDLIARALDAFQDRPLFVLATARPEIDERFPGLFGARAIDVRLAPLTASAAKKLAREVLGASASDALLARVVELADGNAFFLEELLRAAHEGKIDRLPASIVATAGARLDELDDDDRYVLRAASVFEGAVAPRAVSALTGRSAEEARRALDRLAAREVLVERGRTAGGDPLFGFRHDLLREAAYASLVERDRALGHRLAARWLATQPGARADSVARHFERAGEGRSAARFYLVAARSALRACDFATAIALAERALADGPSDGAEARLVLATALRYSNDLPASLVRGEEAFARFEPGANAWYEAAGELLASASALDRTELVLRTVRLVVARTNDDESLARTVALARAVTNAATSGARDLSEEAFAVFARSIGSVLARTSLRAGERALFEDWWRYVLANRASRSWDFGAMLELAMAQSSARALVGDVRGQVYARLMVGYSLLELGSFELARVELAGARERALALSFADFAQIAELYLAEERTRSGDVDGGLAELERLHVEATRVGFSHMIATSRYEAARACVRARRWERARELLREPLPGTLRAAARCALAQVMIAGGDVEGALVEARGAFEDERTIGLDGSISPAFVALARALRAAGDEDGARAIAGEGARELLGRASRVTDPSLRATFLARVQENAELLELARELGASDG